MEDFDPTAYGPEVARVLALDGDGRRLIPLTARACSSEPARQHLKSREECLFERSRPRRRQGGGLWLYFSCFEEAHDLVSALDHPGVRAVARHPASPGARLRQRRLLVSKSRHASRLLDSYRGRQRTSWIVIPRAEFRLGKWDPFAFIAFCERARSSRDGAGTAALEIQRAEWQILFDYCARGKG